MKNFKLLYACLIALIGLFITTGCSDKGDGPDMPEVNYNKLKIGRMDLSGAVSVGLKTGDSSRAIEGEYLSSGMYKIDANGNISAVAVYFTTDTLGNRLEHEEKLRIVPEELFNLTKNYLLVVDCSYYDRDGDEVSDKWEYNEENEEGRWIKQDVPYKHLLVRKSDGKIWCVDNIKDEILEHYFAWKLKGNFVESNRGDLYFIDRAAYKFNLSSDDASFEQITTGDGVDNLFNDAHEYIVTDNGIIGQTDGYNVYFGYPHSGFTTIDRWDLFKKTRVNFPEEIPVEGLEIGEYSDFKWKLSDYLSYDDFVSTILDENSFYLITWQSYELLCKYKSDYKCFYTKDISERKNLNKIATETNALLPSIFKITPGNNPGEYNLAEIAKLEVDMDFNILREYFYYPKFFFTDFRNINKPIYNNYNIYLIFTDQDDISWLTRFNIKDNYWQMIKKLGYAVKTYNIEYQDKLWYFDKDNMKNLGIHWLDINNEEAGFVKFNVSLPDFVKYEGYENGIITYTGADPATSNKVNIYIDITTGEAVNEVKAPEMQFTTIVPLN